MNPDATIPTRLRVWRLVGWLLAACCCGWTWAGEVATTQPFAGIWHVVRVDDQPRPVVIHMLKIDLATPNLHFKLTPPSPERGRETVKQLTLDYLQQEKAQAAVNVHFFEPWPEPKSDPHPGAADLVGLAASQGQVYSSFESKPAKQPIESRSPAINIDRTNQAALVHADPDDPTGRRVREPVSLFTVLSGSRQIITEGKVTVPDDDWHRRAYRARTVAGLSKDGRTLWLVVVEKSARQSSAGDQPSQGMSVVEIAALLQAQPYNLWQAINLDGGGSASLAMQNPANGQVRLLNQTEGPPRQVSSNLAVFAPPVASPPTTAPAIPTPLTPAPTVPAKP